MAHSRLPRFKRASNLPPIQFTDRDHEILRHIHRYRFLRSSRVIALLGGPAQPIQRRLQALFHHGYLERPRAQLDYYHQGGSREIVYGLGNKGVGMLKEELGDSFRHVRWGEKNRKVGRMFFEHALLVSDIMVALELACRESSDVRLITSDELLAEGRNQKRKQFKWKVNIGGGVRLGIVPDQVFALEFADEGPPFNRAYFFLEADRGTMPVKRKALTQSSFYRKLLAYEATWTQNLHRDHFGFHRFRVLTVTSSAERVNSLIDACAALERGHGLFLFGDIAMFKSNDDILTLPWQTGRSGITSSIRPLPDARS